MRPSPRSGQTGQAFGAPVSAQTARIVSAMPASTPARARSPRRRRAITAGASASGSTRARRAVALSVRHRPRLRRQRDDRPHPGAAAGRALELDLPVERSDAVLEALETRSGPEPCPSPAVVGHRDRQAAVLCPNGDRRALRVSVLAHVGEALGHDEVGGGLHLVREALLGRLEDLDRHGRARGEILQRGAQATVGQDRRVDAAREVAQLLEREVRLLPRAADQLGSLRVALLGTSLRHAQIEGERDEPLLGAVVEVALDAPPLAVGGGDDPRAGVLELRHAGGEHRVGVRAEQQAGEPGVEPPERSQRRDAEQQDQRAQRRDGERLAEGVRRSAGRARSRRARWPSTRRAPAAARRPRRAPTRRP